MDQDAINYLVSSNYLLTATHKSQHRTVDGIHITDFRTSAKSPRDYRIEYAASIADLPLLKAQLKEVEEAHLVRIFHTEEQTQAIEAEMVAMGYSLQRVLPLLRINLPMPLDTRVSIEEAFDEDDVDWANETLDDGERPMPPAGVGDPLIRRFYALMDDEAIGWAQMVNAVIPGTAYLGDMYILPDYRGQGAAVSLLNRVHEEAHATDCDHVLLVPTPDTRDFYVKFGYRTIATISNFTSP